MVLITGTQRYVRSLRPGESSPLMYSFIKALQMEEVDSGEENESLINYWSNYLVLIQTKMELLKVQGLLLKVTSSVAC